MINKITSIKSKKSFSSPQAYTILCPAKVNIYLNTLRKREDGFHDIESVFHAVSLYDKITIAPKIGSTLTLKVSTKSSVSSDLVGKNFVENNLLHKVYDYFKKQYNLPGIKVEMIKHIPIGAGLGGGSSNVAGFIIGLNNMFSLGLAKLELEKIGSLFGSDVPFFFTGGMAWVSGRGEIIRKNPYAMTNRILITYPEIFISTPISYQRLNSINPQKNIRNIKSKISTVNQNTTTYVEKKRKIAQILERNLFNSFQEKTLKNHPQLKKLYQQLQKISKFSMMSGSGSSFFCIFHDIIVLKDVCRSLKKDYPSTFVVKCISSGIRVTKGLN